MKVRCHLCDQDIELNIKFPDRSFGYCRRCKLSAEKLNNGLVVFFKNEKVIFVKEKDDDGKLQGPL